jgi:hypothetical protein
MCGLVLLISRRDRRLAKKEEKKKMDMFGFRF